MQVLSFPFHSLSRACDDTSLFCMDLFYVLQNTHHKKKDGTIVVDPSPYTINLLIAYDDITLYGYYPIVKQSFFVLFCFVFSFLHIQSPLLLCPKKIPIVVVRYRRIPPPRFVNQQNQPFFFSSFSSLFFLAFMITVFVRKLSTVLMFDLFKI